MTNEEILLKETSGIFDEHEGGITGIFNAMDEYAKQMALEFFEFERGVPTEEMESNYDYFISKTQNKTNSKMSITIIPQEKKYTQEDIDNARKEGFEAARKVRNTDYQPDFEVTKIKLYPTYEAYLKTLEGK